MKLLVSLHDVTPFHRARLERAEQFLMSLGVDRVTYPLVPNFHGTWPLAEHPEFIAWCRTPRPFEVQWFLHGCLHWSGLSRTLRTKGPVTAWLKATLLTAGEGEFLGLSAEEIRERLAAGIDAVSRCRQATPDGFVAPAWLFESELLSILRSIGFRFTEDHACVYDVQRGRRVSCPVITWATRTTIRRIGSRIVCPALLRRWRRRPTIRVALHPADFDHQATIDNIAIVLTEARRDREVVLYDDALFDANQRET